MGFWMPQNIRRGVLLDGQVTPTCGFVDKAKNPLTTTPHYGGHLTTRVSPLA